MPVKPTRISMPETLEGLGKSGCWLDLEIEAIVYPGEPEVKYLPDGSGHPGCDPEVEITAVFVTAYGFSDSHEAIGRIHRHDWFKVLDRIAENYILDNEYHYQDEILEYTDAY